MRQDAATISSPISPMQGVKTLRSDEHFQIRLDDRYAEASAPGHLLRRCAISWAAPDGFERVGSFKMRVDGLWWSTLGADDSCTSNSPKVSRFQDRFTALQDLWARRAEVVDSTVAVAPEMPPAVSAQPNQGT